MTFEFKTKGVCSRMIHFDLDGTTVRNVEFTGGCNGNLQGIGALVEGMEVDEVIRRLQGIRCGFKGASCPDQLSQALTAACAKLAEKKSS